MFFGFGIGFVEIPQLKNQQQAMAQGSSVVQGSFTPLFIDPRRLALNLVEKLVLQSYRHHQILLPAYAKGDTN